MAILSSMESFSLLISSHLSYGAVPLIIFTVYKDQVVRFICRSWALVLFVVVVWCIQKLKPWSYLHLLNERNDDHKIPWDGQEALVFSVIVDEHVRSKISIGTNGETYIYWDGRYPFVLRFNILRCTDHAGQGRPLVIRYVVHDNRPPRSHKVLITNDMDRTIISSAESLQEHDSQSGPQMVVIEYPMAE
jgi:hypothetical protein